MELTISGVPELVNLNLSTKPKFGDVAMHQTANVTENFKSLGEDELCVTYNRRLRKFNPVNHNFRFWMVSLKNPWVAREVLFSTKLLEKHNHTNETEIFFNQCISKEDQQKNRR